MVCDRCTISSSIDKPVKKFEKKYNWYDICFTNTFLTESTF